MRRLTSTEYPQSKLSQNFRPDARKLRSLLSGTNNVPAHAVAHKLHLVQQNHSSAKDNNEVQSPAAISAASRNKHATGSKRGKQQRLSRGYTHLEGDERVTAAFQKVFGMMQVKEQREEKIQRRLAAEAQEQARLKAERAAERRKDRMAKRKQSEKIKKLANEALRAVKSFLRKGVVAGFNLGDLLKNSAKVKRRFRARTHQRRVQKQPTVNIEPTDEETMTNDSL